MSKHTLGPWKWSDEYTHPSGKPAWTLLGCRGFYGILTCDQGSAPQDLTDEANARLIAAAPELLEALVALETLLSPLAYDSTQKDWLNRAREAIAKATGE